MMVVVSVVDVSASGDGGNQDLQCKGSGCVDVVVVGSGSVNDAGGGGCVDNAGRVIFVVVGSHVATQGVRGW